MIICLDLLRKIKFFSILSKNYLRIDIYTLTYTFNEREEINSVCDFVSGELSEDNINDSEIAQEIDDNRA